MSSPEPVSPEPQPRPGWVDRLLKFLMTEEGVPATPPKKSATPVERPPVVQQTKAGDVYHL